MKEYPWIVYRIGKIVVDLIVGFVLSVMIAMMTHNIYLISASIFIPRMRSIIFGKVRRAIPGRKRLKILTIALEGKVVKKALYRTDLNGVDRLFKRAYVEIEAHNGEIMKVYVTSFNTRMSYNLLAFTVGDMGVIHYREYKGIKHFDRFDKDGVEYTGPVDYSVFRMKKYSWLAYRIGEIVVDLIVGFVLALMVHFMTTNIYLTLATLFAPRIRSIILGKMRRAIPGRKRLKIPTIACEGKVVKKALYKNNLSGMDRFFRRTYIEVETPDGEIVKVYLSFSNNRILYNLEMFNVGDIGVIHYREYKGFKHFERFDKNGIEDTGPIDYSVFRFFKKF